MMKEHQPYFTDDQLAKFNKDIIEASKLKLLTVPLHLLNSYLKKEQEKPESPKSIGNKFSDFFQLVNDDRYLFQNSFEIAIQRQIFKRIARPFPPSIFAIDQQMDSLNQDLLNMVSRVVTISSLTTNSPESSEFRNYLNQTLKAGKDLGTTISEEDLNPSDLRALLFFEKMRLDQSRSKFLPELLISANNLLGKKDH